MKLSIDKKCPRCNGVKLEDRRWYTFYGDLCRCRGNLKTSELEELKFLEDDDYIRITDSSEHKTMKVKLSTIREFIKS
jgi:hypothetical protein